MKPWNKTAAALLVLAMPFASLAEEAPATRPTEAQAVDAASGALSLTADDCKVTFHQLVLPCETDLETGAVRLEGQAILQCRFTAPAGIIAGSIEPQVTSLLDDAGHQFAKAGVRRPLMQFQNREGAPLELQFQLGLPDAPVPPRTIAELKGQLTLKAMQCRPFVFALEEAGQVIAIDKTRSVRLAAVSRKGNILVVGVMFDGVEDIYDTNQKPYLLRSVLIDKNGKPLVVADAPHIVSSNTAAVYRFECPEGASKLSLRVEVVTGESTYLVPMELKLKPHGK